LSFAAPHRKLYELPQPWTFDTQRWQMFDKAPEVTEPIEGISVLQTADVEDVPGSVEISDRSQVLDGIIRYGDDLLIVIETKLDGRVPSRQAQFLNIHGAQVRFDGGVQPVSWRELLKAWSNLIESGMVAGAERTIILDFLDFVDRHFARLGPFATLGQCKDHAFLVKRRLKTVLDEIAGEPTDGWLELSGRSTLDRAYLAFDESSQLIQLKVYPADTLTQAKSFYSHSEIHSNVLLLRSTGWKIEPNFHFAFMAKGLVWTTADASVEKYIAHWSEQIENTKPLPRDKWDGFWRDLVRLRFASSDQKVGFTQSFTKTAREKATPRPGLSCFYSWSLADAKVLDDKHQFRTAVLEQLAIMLQALNEKPIPSTT
jgi:hypothetical protein